MNRNSDKTIKLKKGEVSVYTLGAAKLHAYKTNDPMADEVFILEKNECALVIEAPCFADNIAELNNYIAALPSRVEALVLSYHMAGGTFLPNTPVYATQNAEQFGHRGGGKAMVNDFTNAFGASFDPSLHTVTTILGAGTVRIAGFTLNIIPTADAFDIELPELGAAYIHMLGHDCHSIVAGAGHADALIAQLKGLIAQGIDLILTSHYTPESGKDAQTKIEYLESLKAFAAASANADAFKKAVRQKYPAYTGENYLDMTGGFFFPA
ncbi:MAG: hypothetical protein LBN26_06525 [Christensenellaceae bacterium]|nr:hypothetical protein [Christensenellaceae bacterium]